MGSTLWAAPLPTLHSCCGSCVLKSHRRSVVSPEPLARRLPSGLNATASTDSAWPAGHDTCYNSYSCYNGCCRKLSRTKCIVCGVCSMKVNGKGLLALQCAVCCCSCLRHPISKHLMLVRRKPAPPTWHRGCAARPEHCLGHVHDAPHNSPQHHAPYHTLIDRITTHLALMLCSAPRAAP